MFGFELDISPLLQNPSQVVPTPITIALNTVCITILSGVRIIASLTQDIY